MNKIPTSKIPIKKILMQKLLYCFLIIAISLIVLAGCGKNGDSPAGEPIETAIPTEETAAPTTTPEPTLSPTPVPTDSPELAGESKKRMTEFTELTSKATDAVQLIDFLDANIAHVDQQTADAMFLALDLFYEQTLEKSQNGYYKDGVQEKLTAIDYPIDVDKITDESIKKLVANSIAGKYKLEAVEGTIFPIVDYEALKVYMEYLTEPLQGYLDIMAEESSNKTAADGSIVISLDELAERALATEEYILRYPDGAKTATLKNRYINGYLYLYVLGAPNTPLYNFETFGLSEDFRKSYERTVQEYPNTITGTIIAEYLTVLNQQKDKIFNYDDGVYDPEVKAFHDQYPERFEQLYTSAEEETE